MEKNIFKDAKFGDRFVTKNGQIAIYQRYARERDWEDPKCYSIAHILFTNDKELMCSDDGSAQNYTENDSIISKLDKSDIIRNIAFNVATANNQYSLYQEPQIAGAYHQGYEDGFIKAQEINILDKL